MLLEVSEKSWLGAALSSCRRWPGTGSSRSSSSRPGHGARRYSSRRPWPGAGRDLAWAAPFLSYPDPISLAPYRPHFLKMFARTIWAAALLPYLVHAAPHAPREPLSSGLHFRPRALDAIDAAQATYLGTYGGSAENAVHIYKVASADEAHSEVSDASSSRLVWIGLAGVEGVPDDVVARAFKDLEPESLAPRIAAYQQSHAGASYLGGDGASQSPLGTGASAALTGEMELNILTALSGPTDGKTTAVMAYVQPALLPVLDLFLPSFLVPVAVPLDGFPSHLSGVPKERLDYLEHMCVGLGSVSFAVAPADVLHPDIAPSTSSSRPRLTRSWSRSRQSSSRRTLSG